MVRVYPITPQSQFKNNSRATVPLIKAGALRNQLLLIQKKILKTEISSVESFKIVNHYNTVQNIKYSASRDPVLTSCSVMYTVHTFNKSDNINSYGPADDWLLRVVCDGQKLPLRYRVSLMPGRRRKSDSCGKIHVSEKCRDGKLIKQFLFFKFKPDMPRLLSVRSLRRGECGGKSNEN